MSSGPSAAAPSPAPPAPSRSRATRPGRLAGLTGKSWWPALKRGLTVVFFALVVWLLVTQAREIDWAEVAASLRKYSVTGLVAAAALSAASFVVYSCYDLLGRSYTGHRLSAPTVMTVTFISYVFNLNLGSWVGAIGFRYRLYSRLGLETGVIARITTFSLLTNWIGYLMLGGLVFAAMPPALPANWALSTLTLRLIGVLLVAVAAAYLALCAWSRKRSMHVRGHEIDLPSFSLALLQVAMGATNWLLMSGIVYLLLQQRIEFPAVVSVLLLAAIAGVITHIPAGLGVLEAVFVALLSHRMPPHDILAALVAYRVVYYLVPLVIATLVYGVTEARAKKLARRSDGAAPTTTRSR
jgi:glycosyltransferase 2 family protein